MQAPVAFKKQTRDMRCDPVAIALQQDHVPFRNALLADFWKELESRQDEVDRNAGLVVAGFA